MQQFNLDQIPTELKTRPQWVGFHVKNGKKFPVIADNPQKGAKSNDPATWRNYETAVTGLNQGNYNAIAYALAGDYVVIDMDNCIDGKSVSARAKQCARICASYTETSVSGNGLHIVLRGQCRSRKENGFEIYSENRFIIFTGNTITDNTDIRDLTPDIRVLVENKQELQAREIPPPETPRTVPMTQWPITPEISAVINNTLPPVSGMRNKHVFQLARALKFRPECAESEAGQFKDIVREWHRRALPNIQTKEFDSTWSDFCYALPRVKHAPGINPVIEAWQRIEGGQGMDITSDCESKKLKKLLSLCAELSGMGDRIFFLSMPQAGKLLNVKPMQVSRWLAMLSADGYLRCVQKGDKRRASRYQWQKIMQ